MKLLHHITAAMAATFCVTAAMTVLCSAATRTTSDREEDARKAAYIFIEGNSLVNEGATDDAFALIDRAYRLDTADVDIAAIRAAVLINLEMTDSAATADAYRAIRRRFVEHPDNYDNGTELAQLAREYGQTDDVILVWRTLDSIYPDRSDPALNLAEAYLIKSAKGDSAAYNAAIDIYDRLQQGVGVDPGLSSHKIRAYSLRRDTAAIEAELKRVLHSAPDDPEINLFVSRTYASLNRNDSALVYATRTCELDSANGLALMLRAAIYKERGDSAAFDREIFNALRSHNLEIDAKLDILTGYVAELYPDTLQHTRLSQLFDEMLQINPGEARLHDLYAAFLLQTEQYERAAEQFGYAIDLEPEQEARWQMMVQSLFSADKPERAATIAREAQRRFPTSSLYFPLAASAGYSELGRFNDALEALDAFDPDNFNNPEALSTYWGTRGDVLYQLDSIDSAYQMYEKALSINPHNYMAYNNAAYHMAVRGKDLDRALRYAEAAIEGDPNSATFADTYAWVLFMRKDYGQARKAIDKTLELSGITLGEDGSITVNNEVGDEEISAEIYEHAGDIYYMVDEHEHALIFWVSALQLDPDNKLLQRKINDKKYYAE